MKEKITFSRKATVLAGVLVLGTLAIGVVFAINSLTSSDIIFDKLDVANNKGDANTIRSHSNNTFALEEVEENTDSTDPKDVVASDVSDIDMKVLGAETINRNNSVDVEPIERESQNQPVVNTDKTSSVVGVNKTSENDQIASENDTSSKKYTESKKEEKSKPTESKTNFFKFIGVEEVKPSKDNGLKDYAYLIKWEDNNQKDTNLSIFLREMDYSHTEPVLTIVENIKLSDEKNEYLWKPTNVPAGKEYLLTTDVRNESEIKVEYHNNSPIVVKHLIENIKIISPIGDMNGNNPTFNWTKASNAEWYTIKITRSADNYEYSVDLAAEKVCKTDSNYCYATMEELYPFGAPQLAKGQYQVRITHYHWTYGQVEGSKNTAIANFTISTDVTTKAPKLIAPITNSMDKNPKFEWEHTLNTLWYKVSISEVVYEMSEGRTEEVNKLKVKEIVPVKDLWMNAYTICDFAENRVNAQKCATQIGLNLEMGKTYQWKVEAWGPFGNIVSKNATFALVEMVRM